MFLNILRISASDVLSPIRSGLGDIEMKFGEVV